MKYIKKNLLALLLIIGLFSGFYSIYYRMHFGETTPLCITILIFSLIIYGIFYDKWKRKKTS